MRDYILHVMLKNLRRMKKNKMVSDLAFKKFKLP